MTHAVLSLSVVSHGQAELVEALLNDLRQYAGNVAIEVLLTVNVPEVLPASLSDLPFSLKTIFNSSPLGFGENHNRAFSQAQGVFFGVINPDIRLNSAVFPVLLEALQDAGVGVVAPLVVNNQGDIEDSARVFPSPLKILCKALGRCRGRDYEIKDACILPDWVGGMFMLFRSEVYRQTGGFNEKFFLYYEDVDLCARLWLQGLNVMLVPQVRVTHDARRSSHKRLRYLRLHLGSMAKFFISPTYWRALYLRRIP